MYKYEKTLSESEELECPSSFLAAQLVAPRKIEYVEVKCPELMPGEVLVRVKGSGVCISDLPYWTGDTGAEYPMPPGAPGHEGWGTIVEVGPLVKGVKAGQYVTFISDRAYAEYAVISHEELVVLPEEMANKPFPGQAFGSIANVFKRADILPGQTVVIIGDDIIARGLLWLCALVDVRIVTISENAKFLEEAAVHGQTFLISDKNKLVIEKDIHRFTQGKGCDRIVECSGQQQSLHLACRLAAEYGKIIIAGYHLGGLRQIDLECCYSKSLDLINAHEVSRENKRKGIIMAAASVLEGVLDPDKLLTRRYDFRDLATAFDNFLHADKAGKAYVTMG